MNISTNSKDYFLLGRRFCHLLLATFLFLPIHLFAQEKAKSTMEVDFLTKILDQILPGKDFNAKATSPLDSFEIFQKKSEAHVVWVTYWQYQSYRYPLFVQVFNQRIQDIYLTFPSFFRHDYIHSELIKRWGQQNFYQHAVKSSLYRWDNIKQGSTDLVANYEANCSITCFPVAIDISLKQLPEKVTTLWKEFQPTVKNKKSPQTSGKKNR